MAKLKLSPPWDIFYKEVDAFFKEDGDVKVIFDEDEFTIKLYVDDATKAAALTELLPTEKDFGNVVLKISVIPANEGGRPALGMPPYTAFYGNPIVDEIKIIRDLFGYDLVYVMFVKEVVQYFTDNISDYNGFCSTLYENIARNIFEGKEGVFYCTSAEDEEPKYF